MLCLWYNLEWAEGEVDKVPGVATTALHAFIDQHSEDNFMDPQQRNQHQSRSGQAEGYIENKLLVWPQRGQHMRLYHVK